MSYAQISQQPFMGAGLVAVLEAERYAPPMPEIPTPFVETDHPDQPDSPELAALYEERAGRMEQEAADARSPQQAEGLRLGAATFRRKAAEIRRRLEGA